MIAAELARDDVSPTLRVAEQGWSLLAERDAALFELVNEVHRDPSTVTDLLAETPQTFIAGDWKMGNLGSRPSGETVVLDWAYPGEAPRLGAGVVSGSEPSAHTREQGRHHCALPSGAGRCRRGHEDPGGSGSSSLCLLAMAATMGWEKAVGDADELAWWSERAQQAAEPLAAVMRLSSIGGSASCRRSPSFRSRPVPSDGVVVAVRATGLCRSDWHAWMGHEPVPLPHVPGHEFAGVIDQVGVDVDGWSVGDRVTSPFVYACGTCAQCRAGDHQICDRQEQPGFSRWGSFAERVVVTHAQTNLVRLPDALGFAAAASLGCRFATAYRAVVVQGRLAADETLLVSGCGGWGSRRSRSAFRSALGSSAWIRSRRHGRPPDSWVREPQLRSRKLEPSSRERT